MSFVEEIPSGGAKLYINVEDMVGAMDVSLFIYINIWRGKEGQESLIERED